MADKILEVTASRINAAVKKVEKLPEQGVPGADGKSAYQIWLEQGNKGTQQDFLNSLKGQDGLNGKSIEYTWRGTELGIRQEGQLDYTYVNLKGETGQNAVNPNFTIGTVTTLPSGSDATVTLTGTYPNLVLNFGIPRGADGSGGGTEEPVDTTPYMYYGRLSIQDVGDKVIPYSQITEAMINKGVTDGKLTKATPKTMGKTSMGKFAETAEFDYIIVAVPTSKNYTVTKDNGFGGKVSWDEDTAGANGIDITINNVPCKLYGEMLISQGQYFIYVD